MDRQTVEQQASCLYNSTDSYEEIKKKISSVVSSKN